MEKQNSLKVLLLIGSNANQRALACKIAKEHEVVGIVCENRPSKVNRSFYTLLKKIKHKIRFYKIDQVWVNLMNYYHTQFPEFPEAPLLEVSSINHEDVLDFTKKQPIDVVIVSGTSLLRKPLLEAIQSTYGILNLHTGLSPYVKGGPNCTNWCIANNKFHLIGNTVMWIDEGIDSGNLVTTECTPLLPNDSLLELHIRVMEHAHDLYLRSLRVLASNPDKMPNVPQKEISKGNLYLTKHWTDEKKQQLLKNFSTFKNQIESTEFCNQRNSLKVVNLPV